MVEYYGQLCEWRPAGLPYLDSGREYAQQQVLGNYLPAISGACQEQPINITGQNIALDIIGAYIGQMAMEMIGHPPGLLMTSEWVGYGMGSLAVPGA